MANLIQIKRSDSTATPSSLEYGELAWSDVGDKLYIGSNTGTVIAIGGNYLTNSDGNIEIDGSTIELANSINITSLTLSGVEVTDISANLDLDSSATSLVTADAVVDYVQNITGGSISLSGLTDTNITSPADGSLLFYDTGTSKWIDNAMSGDATIADTGVLTLSTVNDNVGTFGDANTVAQITVNAKGLITAASDVDIDHDALLNFVSDEHVNHLNVAITAGDGLTGGGDITESRTLTVNANNGITVTTDGVFVNGANGISVDASGVNVQTSGDTISVDASGIAVNELNLTLTSSQISDLSNNVVTSLTGTANEIVVDQSTGSVTIGLPDSVTISDTLTVAGDLIVNGNTTTINVQDLFIEDGLIHLGSNNVADSIDMGLIFHYSDDAGVTAEHAGLFRDADDEKFYLFKNLIDANLDDGAITVNRGGTGYAEADLVVAGLEATSLTLTTDLAVEHGGTGASSFTDNGIIYGNGTGALSVTAAGTEGQVLQAGSGGVPEFGSLDGGTF